MDPEQMGKEECTLLVGGNRRRPCFLTLEADAQIKEDGRQGATIAHQVQAGPQLTNGLIELPVLRERLCQSHARLPIVRMVLYFSLQALDAQDDIGMPRN